MTVGMSAPPIRRTNIVPNARPTAMRGIKRRSSVGVTVSATTSASPAASTTRFTTFWPRYTSGRSGSTPWSLPNATRLPVNVR